MLEFCHNIERVAQPVPARNPGGDCFACAATAGLRFLFPERTVNLDDVWDMFVVEYYDGKAQENLQKLRTAVGEHLDGKLGADALTATFREVSAQKPNTTVKNTWSGFPEVLEKASREWGRLEVTWDMVEPHFDKRLGRPSWSYAWRFQDCGIDYARRLEGWLRSGWVAWTEIKMHGGGPFTVDGEGVVRMNSIDHFILIDGVRRRYVEEALESGSRYGSWKDEMHVVDSSSLNLTGWHDIMRFTRARGASSWWLARRDRTRDEAP